MESHALPPKNACVILQIMEDPKTETVVGWAQLDKTRYHQPFYGYLIKLNGTKYVITSLSVFVMQLCVINIHLIDFQVSGRTQHKDSVFG